MTFAQYIENPMGKANAVFSGRDSFRAQYTEKFDQLYMREAGKIDRWLYFDKVQDAYFVHFKMPSETVKDFYYDVVIRFYTNDNAERVNSSLKNYEVQFFSNDPAFVYTYLYVFHKHKMIIDDLKVKCPKASLTMRPEQRNAYEVPGYVKSIYFAYILMSRTDLFLKTTYETLGRRYSKGQLLQKVANYTNKMEERKEKESRQKAAAKKIAGKPIAKAKPEPSKTGNVKAVKRVNTISPIKPTTHKSTGNINRLSVKNKKAK